jgi:hypothetical protein
MPGGKTSVHLRIDSDIFERFKKQGEGHLPRMNVACGRTSTPRNTDGYRATTVGFADTTNPEGAPFFAAFSRRVGHQNADTAGYRTRVERTFSSAAVAVVLGVPTRLCASKRARVVMPSGRTPSICASTATYSSGSRNKSKAISPA